MDEFTLDGVHYRLAEHPDHPRLVRFLPTATPATIAHFSTAYDPTDVLAVAREDRSQIASCPRCGFPRRGYAHGPTICRERESTFARIEREVRKSHR